MGRRRHHVRSRKEPGYARQYRCCFMPQPCETAVLVHGCIRQSVPQAWARAVNEPVSACDTIIEWTRFIGTMLLYGVLACISVPLASMVDLLYALGWALSCACARTQ